MAILDHVFDRMLDPLAAMLPPEAAQRIAHLEPPADVVARVEELAEKLDSGVATEEDRKEYQVLADAGTFMAILKAKLRRRLA